MSETRTATQEWKAHWPLVLAAMIGVSFGSVLSLTLGLFMEPLEQEFGWTRAQMALGMTIVSAIGIPLAPLAGHLIDRFGGRRVAIPGMALTALALAGFSLLTGAYWQWIATWLVYGVAGALIRQTVWSRAIAGAFETSRGMALAAMLTGTAITTAIAPSIGNALIAELGWRSAYLTLGLGWGGLALALLVLFFHERVVAAPATEAERVAAQLPGLSFAEAMRNRAVLSIGLAITLQAAIGGAFLIHVVPLLGWAGLARGEAALLAGLIGLGSLVSKFACGWLADRFQSGLIPFVVFVLPGLGYAGIAFGQGSHLALGAAVLMVGMGSGGGFHMTNYLLTRHAGLANFGKIFGMIAAAMSIGTGIGPLLAGHVFDVTGSYALLLYAGIPMALVSGLLVAFLGPYPDLSARRAAA